MEVWNVWISKKSARVGIYIYIYATSSIHGLEFELFTFIYFHDVICVSLRRTKRQKLRTTLVHPSLQSIKSLHIKGPISAATTRSLISVINLNSAYPDRQDHACQNCRHKSFGQRVSNQLQDAPVRSGPFWLSSILATH